MTALQLPLPIEAPKQPVLNLTGIVRAIMLDHEWIAPFELQKEVLRRTGEMHSDSALTARIRELRRSEFGGYEIVKRRKVDSRAYEYSLRGQA